MTVILGVKTNNIVENSNSIQNILSGYSCYIKTRLGIHNILGNICPKIGIILLEIPQKDKAILIENDLLNISDIEIQRMEFDIN
jgi:hypothetical protein